jgi:PKD repeat protein
VAQDNGRYVAIITNAGDNTLMVINFGSSVTSTPAAADLVKTPPLSATSLELISTSVIRDCGRWYGLTVANANSQVFRLNFGASLFSLPDIERLPVTIPADALLFNNQLTYDGGFVAVISGLNGSLYHLSFGENMTDAGPVTTSIGLADPISDIAGFTLLKENSRWFALAGSFSSNKVFRLSFPDPCGTPLPASELSNPATITYSNGGPRKITLTAFNGVESKSSSYPVFVRPSVAVNFMAAGSPPVFTALPAPGDKFSEWKWEFGDGAQSQERSPAHNFLANGEYPVKLTVKNVCGQTGTITKKLTIAGNTVLSCPYTAFSLPDTVCINEPFKITNNSIGAERHEWDFCSGDLTAPPSVGMVTTIPSANILSDVTTVFDGTNWFGFASSRDNNKLFRLEFGNSLYNSPTIVEMANPGGLLIRPEQMKFLKEGENWYALVITLNNFINGFGVFRLRFGNSLSNAPQAERLSVLDRFLKQPRGLVLAQDGSDVIAVIANYTSNSLLMVRFAGSISVTPTSNDVLASSALPNSPSGLISISVIKSCNQWYGVASSYNNKFYRLAFGARLFSIPTVSDLSGLYSFPIGLGRTVLVKNHTDYLAFVLLFNGDLLRYNFGRDITNNFPTVKKVANFVGDGFGLELVQQNSDEQLLATDYFSKAIYRFSFPVTCSAGTFVSTQPNPDLVSYSQAGWKRITLTSYNQEQNTSSFSDSVFVRPALTADFAVDRQCLGAATVFRANLTPAGNRIVSRDWTFSDGGTATGPEPTHTFASAGDYTATLTERDVCGKTISKTQTVKIYQNTIPDFSGPLEFCSSQPQTFADASTISGDTPVSYRWSFGNGILATGAQVNYAYPLPGKYTVTLTVTGTSGCNTSVSKEVTVKPGVNVNFSQARACLSYETQFSDQSVVAEGTEVVSRTWNFGDNTTSNALNPMHRYAGAGSYPVTLTIVSSAGCINTRTQTVTIRQLPRPAFSVSLACSGEQVAFTDESLSPEGNITGWQWTFDDPDSGNQNTSPERNPQHLFGKPGTYQVRLKIFTNFGCADSLTKAIAVTQSPQSDFTYHTNCNSREVTFTNQSSAGNENTITDWYWDFGDNGNSTVASPLHTYAQPGSYTVTLITTSSTRCQNVVRKTVHIYRPPVAEFTTPSLICTGVPITLADNSTLSAGDPVVQWQWQVGDESFNQSSVTVTFAAGAGLVPVTLSVTTASGCQSSITRQIAVRETPAVSFSYQASVLQPLRVNFTGTTSGATGVTWNFGDGQTSDLASPVHTYSSGGIYEVSLAARNAEGCQRVVIQTVTVTTVADSYELKLEGVSVITTGTSQSLQVRLLNGSTKTLSTLKFAVVPDGGAPYEQNWTGSLLPGTLISYSIPLPPEAGASANGVICVQASDQSTGTTSNRQCINLANTLSLLSPAPNPASVSFRLGFILPESGEARTEMIDAAGRVVVAAVNFRYPAGYSEKTQSVAHLARGLYFIRLTFNGQVQIKPLFVH